MIDINELRRLAQAATPGPWWVNQDSLNHGFECGVLEINAKDWHALAGAWGVTGAKPSEEGAANAAFIAAANPAAINELLDRLEAAEKEAAHIKEVEFPRKVLAVAVGWKTKCVRLEQERDALRARIDEMEKQEPYAFAVVFPESSRVELVHDLDDLYEDMTNEAYEVRKLYLTPGAKGE